MQGRAITIDETVDEQFEALASEQGRLKSELIAEALQGYLKDELDDQAFAVRDDREFTSSIERARADVKAGRGLTHDEVLAQVRAILPHFRRP
jgi:predicted transcriptional regulator